MERKKLEKKTLFIFKKKSFISLSNEQMRRIRGGEDTKPTTGSGGPSTLPGCAEDKLTTTTISN